MALEHDEMNVAIAAARRWIDGTGAIGISDHALTQLVTSIIQAIDQLWESHKSSKKPIKAKAGDD